MSSKNYQGLSKILSIFNISLFALVMLVASSIIPIYPDAISYHYTDSIITNGFEFGSLIPQCGKLNIPVTISGFPLAFMKGVLYLFSSPLLIRSVQIFSVLIFILLLFKIIDFNLRLSSVIISILNIGTLQFALIIGRPEISVLIGISISVLLMTRPSKYASLILVPVFLFTISVLPKALILTPMFIIFMYFTKSNIRLKLISIISSILFSFEHYIHYKNRFLCEKAPWLDGITKDLYLSPSYLISSPIHFFKKVFQNLIDSKGLINSILLSENYPGGWLPLSFNDFEGYNYYIMLFVGFVLIATIALTAYLISKKENWIVPTSIIFTLVALKSLESYISWYTAIMYVPVLSIIISYVLIKSQSALRLGIRLSPILSTLSIINSICLFYAFIPLFSQNINMVKIDSKTYERFSPKQTRALNDKVLTFANEMCGIKNSRKFDRLISDDVTYFSFKKVGFPISAHYVLGWWSKDIPNLREFFQKNNIPGFVLSNCEVIENRENASIKSKIKYRGQMCCINLL